ncbi:phosphatase PAP2 family protein [Sphingorhabdus sp. SMR4y]|uniref:phosphatase PAP2 family protein n=1 Tax=Sphingorhabdus sp. SMR4y TaxID=2584094 RepID=UPI000B5C8855|nr:phosphatase PAP2 family protein [Sphingorhabdus sp. SMR4y]ASK89663.1 undecaprenyl pyrophosphate phosphatase [Sphingorhabdus sp. SMR4y]
MSIRLISFQRGFKLAPSFILTGIFLVFWSEVAKGYFDAIDRTILLAFRSPGNSDILIGPDWLLQVVRTISFLGDSTFLLLVIFAVSFLLIANKAYYNALLLAALSLSGFWAVSLLKDFFGRPRPSIVEYFSDPSSASFPSGHAANSTIVYVLIALALFTVVSGRYGRFSLICCALILAALIGTSRIVLGVHWPSDVLGGWIFGLSWCCLWLVSDARSELWAVSYHSNPR